MFQTIDLLGVKVSRVDLALAKDHICQWIKEKARVYVCVAPASTLVDARRDKAYRDVINGAAMVTPDGMPVVWLARYKGCKEVKRTYGPDLMRLLCQTPLLRHYFYGSTKQVMIQLCERVKVMNPEIIVAGTFCPPYCQMAQMEDDAVIKAINDAKPDIIWVGLGSPKQDFWVAMHRRYLNAPVMVGVGAAFDFLAQTKPQAPEWMRQNGLEWFFRLCSEPRRLWKRYVIGNALFIYFTIEDLFFKKS